MKFQAASTGSVVVFVLIVGAVIAAFLAGVHRAYRTNPRGPGRMTVLVGAGLFAWLGALSWLVAAGQLEKLPLNGIPFFFASVAAISLAVGFSRLGGRLADGVPLAALVGFQAFRLPLELVLHAWANQGTIPVTMTWTGQNWDIISGVVALAACPWAGRHRGIAWLANIIGLGLLLNVMRVALFSAPVPFGWNVKPPLLVALHLPYAWIGPVCVGGALVGHIVLTRALLRRGQ